MGTWTTASCARRYCSFFVGHFDIKSQTWSLDVRWPLFGKAEVICSATFESVPWCMDVYGSADLNWSVVCHCSQPSNLVIWSCSQLA